MIEQSSRSLRLPVAPTIQLWRIGLKTVYTRDIMDPEGLEKQTSRRIYRPYCHRNCAFGGMRKIRVIPDLPELHGGTSGPSHWLRRTGLVNLGSGPVNAVISSFVAWNKQCLTRATATMPRRAHKVGNDWAPRFLISRNRTIKFLAIRLDLCDGNHEAILEIKQILDRDHPSMPS
jgi:hypothetical protein